MRNALASRIMPRTTIDIEASLLRRVKRLARTTGKSMGSVVSELLATALAQEDRPLLPDFRWESHRMRARLDLEDKDAVYAALERK